MALLPNNSYLEPRKSFLCNLNRTSVRSSEIRNDELVILRKLPLFQDEINAVLTSCFLIGDHDDTNVALHFIWMINEVLQRK
jgi:hypothetical protein